MYKNLAAAFAAACFFAPVFSQTAPPKGGGAEPVKAGFVYVSPITEAGWTRQHEEGARLSKRLWAARSKPRLSRT